MINLIKNRDDLERWLLATSDYGAEIEQNLTAVVGQDEKFNNSIVRHALDLRDQPIFHNPNALNVTFYDMKKFDQVNPIIGKLATQVRASKLTDKELNQKLLDNFEAHQIQARLDRLKYGGPDNDDDDDDDNKKGPGGTPGGTPLRKPDPLADDDELLRRLNHLRGNDEGELLRRFNRLRGFDTLSPVDVEYLNFYNQRIKQREKEITGLKKGAKGNVRKKRSSIEPNLKFRLPDTPPPSFHDPYWEGEADEWIPNNTSLSGPPLFDYDRDFPPLNRSIQSRNLPPIAPENISSQNFYSTPLPSITSEILPAEKSISSLRNKLPSIDPFPSLPNINNFSRPITDIVDEKNKTIVKNYIKFFRMSMIQLRKEKIVLKSELKILKIQFKK